MCKKIMLCTEMCLCVDCCNDENDNDNVDSDVDMDEEYYHNIDHRLLDRFWKCRVI